MTKPGASLESRHLVAPVTERRGVDGDVPNTWLILGKNPEGPKKQIRVQVGLPAKHPLSAESLSWHGKPHENTVVIENKHLGRKEQARKVGLRLRDKAIRERVEYEVNALPVIPWIRPGALISVPTEAGRVSARASQWTLPLGPGANPMTIGANRRSKA